MVRHLCCSPRKLGATLAMTTFITYSSLVAIGVLLDRLWTSVFGKSQRRITVIIPEAITDVHTIVVDTLEKSTFVNIRVTDRTGVVHQLRHPLLVGSASESKTFDGQ
jgi:hypothetical protein